MCKQNILLPKSLTALFESTLKSFKLRKIRLHCIFPYDFKEFESEVFLHA